MYGIGEPAHVFKAYFQRIIRELNTNLQVKRRLRVSKRLAGNGLGTVLDAGVHGKFGARVVVVGHTLRRGMGLGDGNDVALPREVRLFWMMRGRLREVRLGMRDADWFFWVTIAEDDVIPVGDVVPPEVGLSHLFWSGGHLRPPPQWFPQFC